MCDFEPHVSLVKVNLGPSAVLILSLFQKIQEQDRDARSVWKQVFMKNALGDMLFLRLENASFLCLFVLNSAVEQIEYSKSKAALCFFCMLTHIKPLESSGTQPSVQILTRWAGWFVPDSQISVSGLCWSTAGQTSETCKKYSALLTAPWICDHGSGWIYKERTLQVVVLWFYLASRIIVNDLFRYGRLEMWFVFCVDRATNTFLLQHLNCGRLGFMFFAVTCSLKHSACIAYCYNKKLG